MFVCHEILCIITFEVLECNEAIIINKHENIQIMTLPPHSLQLIQN